MQDKKQTSVKRALKTALSLIAVLERFKEEASSAKGQADATAVVGVPESAQGRNAQVLKTYTFQLDLLMEAKGVWRHVDLRDYKLGDQIKKEVRTIMFGFPQSVCDILFKMYCLMSPGLSAVDDKRAFNR